MSLPPFLSVCLSRSSLCVLGKCFPRFVQCTYLFCLRAPPPVSVCVSFTPLFVSSVNVSPRLYKLCEDTCNRPIARVSVCLQCATVSVSSPVSVCMSFVSLSLPVLDKFFPRFVQVVSGCNPRARALRGPRRRPPSIPASSPSALPPHAVSRRACSRDADSPPPRPPTLPLLSHRPSSRPASIRPPALSRARSDPSVLSHLSSPTSVLHLLPPARPHLYVRPRPRPALAPTRPSPLLARPLCPLTPTAGLSSPSAVRSRPPPSSPLSRPLSPPPPLAPLPRSLPLAPSVRSTRTYHVSGCVRVCQCVSGLGLAT